MKRSVLLAVALVGAAQVTMARPAQGQVLDLPEGGQHVVVVGNTLWDLAAHFYGDPFLWPRIYEANTDRVEDPHWIYPGQMLRIPDAEGNITEVMVVSGEPGQEYAPLEPAEPMVQYREPERTKFWRDTTNVERAAEEALARWVAVPEAVFYSAPFLDFTNGGQAVGQIVGYEGDEEIRNRRDGMVLYDRVLLELDGDMPAPGTRLQVFRLAPAREELVGLVATPTGVVTVLHRSPDGVVASVDAQYDLLARGNLIRPLPTYRSAPGVVAAPVENGPTGQVIAYHRSHELHQPGNYLFLDMGRQDGVGVGDEFVITLSNPEARVEGRAQIVGVQDEVSTARIVMIRNAVFVDGAELTMDRKMPAPGR